MVDSTRRRRLLPYDRRRRLRNVRRRTRPVVISAAALIVLVTGVVGYERQLGTSLLDSLYRTIQLFGFGGSVPDHPNVWLEVARFLGPAIVGYAAIRGVLALFREQFDLLRIRFLRNHVVVVGLGATGFRIATALDRDDMRVVAVARDTATAEVDGCRERGILVIRGDATDPETLEGAGIPRASLMVVTCGDDRVNVDIAAAARAVSRGRRHGLLTALVQLDDLELWQIMKSHALVDRDEARMRLELFNLAALEAELLLERYPAFDATDPSSTHVLMAGMAGIGPTLVLDLVRQWQGAPTSEDDRLRITIASSSADVDLRHLVDRYPGIDEVRGAELTAWNVDLESPSLLASAPADVSSIYVCLPSETEGLARALALRQQPLLWNARIVISVADAQAGVGRALRRPLAAFARTHTFGLLSVNIAREALRHSATEKIARLGHELHVQRQLSTGPGDDPSLLPWDDPRFPHRESNRLWADGLAKKLADVNCMIVPAPLVDPRDPGFVLTDEEVERLAPGEHERWETDLKRLGWRNGPVKDPVRKLHPMIDVPYDELPEENKEKDRQHVRVMVEILARVGFRIQRVGGPVSFDAEVESRTTGAYEGRM